jgi:hypothetical protein
MIRLLVRYGTGIERDIVRKSKRVALLGCLAVAALAWAQDSGIDAAGQLFARYVALEQAYDPGLADLYADDALIKTRRKPPMGDARDEIIPAPEYKRLLRQLMPAAKARGDRSTYANVTYTPQGEFVRIEASRLSGPSQRASPISLLVGRSPSGKWLIYEESSEASP